MRDFEYEAPGDLAQALQYLASGPACRPMAGGTDLIDQVRTGRLAPDLIVDIKNLPELNRFDLTDDGLRLGAAVPCYKVYGNTDVRNRYSALADSTHIIGGVQVQSRASVGGNLCNSGPAGDSIPSLIALNAQVVIADPSGLREVPVDQFCTAPGKNILQPGELVVELKIPALAPRSGSHYRRFIPRNEMDIAVVGVAAAITLDESGQTIAAARVALGAVAPTPLLVPQVAEALIGKPATEETWKAAGEVAASLISPITDMRGTKEFRLHVTKVLVERVVDEAVKRAGQTH